MSVDYQQWEMEHPAMTKTQVQRMAAQGCAIPNCTHEHEELLFLRAKCHPRGKLDVAYFRGSLYVSCRICETFIARFKISPEVVQ